MAVISGIPASAVQAYLYNIVIVGFAVLHVQTAGPVEGGGQKVLFPLNKLQEGQKPLKA